MGWVTSVDNLGTPGAPRVYLSYTYDANGNRKTMSESVGGNANGLGVAGGTISYRLDALNRVTRLDQSGNQVANKTVTLGYNGYGELTNVYRRSGSLLSATSQYGFDSVGRLTSLLHNNGANGTIAQYGWSFDDVGRLVQATMPEGSSNYTYDDTNQLLGADHSSQADESYAYDATGNRTNSGYLTGANNRVQSDGVNNYLYDKQGNRTKSTEIATGKSTEYTWDYRNRLTRVLFKDAAGAVSKDVSYTYDMLGRRLLKTIDSDGPGPSSATLERYIYDGSNVILQFDGAGVQTHRYLHGPGVDQVLADEIPGQVVRWLLADHQGTVKDIVDRNGAVLNHIV